MTYRAAIIGLGFIGGADQVSGDALGQLVADLDGTHLTALQQHPDVELVAGSSRDEGRRERFAKRTNARTYDDWQTMLATEDLDIVSIATYAPQHAEMTLGCFEQGVRAVYCEKPIATCLADAEQMVARADQSGSLLVLNHNRRFNPAFRQLRDVIASGQLGDLTSANVAWGSGRLGNVGTHIFNAVQMLCSRRVVSVSATLDFAGRADCRGPAFQDPGGWGLLRLEEGLIVTFDAADFATLPATITINGTLGQATARNATIVVQRQGQPAESWPEQLDSSSSMDTAVAEIVKWLAGEASFPDAAEESLHTLEAILACHASHYANSAWKDLPLTGEDRERVVASG